MTIDEALAEARALAESLRRADASSRLAEALQLLIDVVTRDHKDEA